MLASRILFIVVVINLVGEGILELKQCQGRATGVMEWEGLLYEGRLK